MTDHPLSHLVDAATLERRRSACGICPYHHDAPSKQHGLCMQSGAVADHKARIATETCPAEDPADPRLTRWGELKASRP